MEKLEEIDGLKPPEKWSFKDPYVRALCKKEMGKLKPSMFHYLDHWAAIKPNEIAIIEHDTGETVTWAKFAQASKAFAARLLEFGLEKGDYIATSLPFLKEHTFLQFGCMRLGVIFAPLDLRLTAREINHCFDRIKPKMYFFLGETPVKDFRPVIQEVMKNHDSKTAENGSVKEWIQFQKSTDGVIEGAMHVKTFAHNITYSYLWNSFKEFFGYGVYGYEQQITLDDGCCVIFTTGSTGPSKAALLHNESILHQNLAFHLAFYYPAEMDIRKRLEESGEKLESVKILVNLPPSHVGGLTELFYTSVMAGSISVLLHIFDAKKSMEAIEKHRIQAIGQIPACFNLQWALPNYEDYDTSSLILGGYGGQSVSREFILKMTEMCTNPATAYGITEISGVCTFTPYGCSAEDVMKSLGYDTPCCKITVREPMKEDGSPGKEFPEGEVGEICCEGPMVFKGYVGMPEATKRAICLDENGQRVYYTGDLGSYDSEEGLRFCSRRKFVLKPKGFQVFPSEVEAVYCENFKESIQFVGCVGVKHDLFSQGIVAVIKFKKDAVYIPTIEDLKKVARSELASYKRPLLYIFVEDFPLNRTRKTDYLEVQKISDEYVKKLRQEGGWDVQEKKE